MHNMYLHFSLPTNSMSATDTHSFRFIPHHRLKHLPQQSHCCNMTNNDENVITEQSIQNHSDEKPKEHNHIHFIYLLKFVSAQKLSYSGPFRSVSLAIHLPQHSQPSIGLSSFYSSHSTLSAFVIVYSLILLKLKMYTIRKHCHCLLFKNQITTTTEYARPTTAITTNMNYIISAFHFHPMTKMAGESGQTNGRADDIWRIQVYSNPVSISVGTVSV